MVALGALAVALALGGCGGDSTSGGSATAATESTGTAGDTTAPSGAKETTTSPSAGTKGTAANAGGPQGSKANANAAIEAGACGPQLDEFLADLEGLRKNLVVGVSYEQYVSELGALRKIYDGIPVDQLDLACLSGAAAGAEQSFDGYLAAANIWGDCVSNSACQTAEVEPKLQHKWRLAAQQLKRAQTAAG